MPPLEYPITNGSAVSREECSRMIPGMILGERLSRCARLSSAQHGCMRFGESCFDDKAVFVYGWERREESMKINSR